MNPERLTGLTHAFITAQIGATQAALATGLNALARLNHLNASTAAATLAESQVMLQAMMAADDGQDRANLVRAQFSPGLKKALAYGRHLNGISSEIQEGMRLAALKQVALSREQVGQLAQAREEGVPLPAGSVEALENLVDGNARLWEQLAEANRHQCQALQASLDLLLDQWQQRAAQE